MVDQDRLEQVGSGLTLEEPMAQDNTVQGDLSLQLTTQQLMEIMRLIMEMRGDMQRTNVNMKEM